MLEQRRETDISFSFTSWEESDKNGTEIKSTGWTETGVHKILCYEPTS